MLFSAPKTPDVAVFDSPVLRTTVPRYPGSGRFTAMGSRIWTVLPALLAGVLIGAVLMQFLAPSVSGTSVPSHGMATATGCLDVDDPDGWLGVVPDGDYLAVYLMNYTVVHTATDGEITGELTETEPNVWEFAITVTPGTGERSVPDGCQTRSIIDASIAIPPSAESVTITLDGESIVHIDTLVTSPRFSYIDD